MRKDARMHAGWAAASAAAKMGSQVLLVTMNLQNIAQMSCNPAMGGVAKGQIVREKENATRLRKKVQLVCEKKCNLFGKKADRLPFRWGPLSF